MPLTKSASLEAFRTNVAEMIRSGKPRDQALAASYRNARQYGAKFADGGGTPWIERTSAHGLSHQGMIHSAVPGRTDKLPISVAGGAYILPADHLSALGQGNSQAGADVVNRVFKMGPYAGNPLGRMGGGPKAIRPTVPKLGRMGGKPHFATGGSAQLAADEMPFFAESPDDYTHPWTATNAELSNWFRNRGETREQARESLRSHLMRSEGTPGYRPDVPPSQGGTQIEDYLSTIPAYASGGAAHRAVPIIAAGGEFSIPPEKVAELGGGDMDRGHRILDTWVKSTRRQHIKTLRGLKPPKR